MEFYLAALWGIFPGNGFVPESIRPLLSEIWRSAHGELTEVYRERLGTGRRRRRLRRIEDRLQQRRPSIGAVVGGIHIERIQLSCPSRGSLQWRA